MRKFLCAILLTTVMTACLSATAFAYTGGPLDGTTTHEDTGGIIFDNGTTVTTTEEPVLDALYIIKDPGGETKKAGEECVFTASANGSDYVRWYIVTPKGETQPASEIPTLYSGVSVTGTSSDRLVISNVTSEMSGSRFFASYTSGDLTLNTTTATLTVEGSVVSPTPAATPTPTPTPAPTPTVYSNNSTSGGVTSDGSSGSTSMLGTNKQNYNQDTDIGTESSADEPSSGSDFNATIENTSASSSHVGAYVLAGVAGIVIIASVIVMALYMKGKISLGKFEKLVGGSEGNEDQDGEYYNPDDYDDTIDNKK